VVNREYSYYILNQKMRPALNRRFVYHVEVPLDVEAMESAARMLIGEHNFASFTEKLGGLRKTIRKVFDCGIERIESKVIFHMTANSFLPHQIRNTVGAILQVGLGRMTVNTFYDMMEAKLPGAAGPRVPARGLFLMRINYSKPIGEIN
jgi:tRNA pseudouridine38-40 synthase